MRWQLISQDRARAQSFQFTPEFLAYMLGMRRVCITSAVSALQRDGLIQYHRGEITVLDRSSLGSVACGCYAADQKITPTCCCTSLRSLGLPGLLTCI